MGRMTGDRPANVSAALPYASLQWHDGPSTIEYRLATMVANPNSNDQADAATWLPAAAVRNGRLLLDRGLHQEIGYERQTDSSDLAVMVYADKIDNPILDAMSRVAGSSLNDSDAPSAVLIDPGSSMVRTVATGFSATGVSASVEHQIAGGNRIAVSYSSGSALVMPALPNPATIQQMMTAAHAHRPERYVMFCWYRWTHRICRLELWLYSLPTRSAREFPSVFVILCRSRSAKSSMEEST